MLRAKARAGFGGRRVSSAAQPRESSVRHVVDVSEPKFGDGYLATCKCGWRSEEMATNSAAVRKGIAHLQEIK